MSYAFIVHGAIGSGKTVTCLRIMEKARSEGLEVGGVISTRTFEEGRLIGYDCLDAYSGEIFPLVRLREMVDGEGWFEFGGLKYAFSREGFDHANEILNRSAEEITSGALIFTDEFGRLEAAGLGLHRSILKVVDGLENGCALVLTCRDDLTETAEKLLKNRIRNVLKYEPVHAEALWQTIRGISSLGLDGDLFE